MAAFQTPKRDVFVTTQNIDELHQRAGSWNVFELHGNLRRIIFKRYKNTKYLETFESLAKLPRCPDCQAILRPEVVLYGEALPGGVPGAFHRQQVQGFDVVFTVGTTSLFQYVIEPMLAAVRQGVPVVEINPDITPVFELAGFRFAGPAGETLAKLAATLAV